MTDDCRYSASRWAISRSSSWEKALSVHAILDTRFKHSHLLISNSIIPILAMYETPSNTLHTSGELHGLKEVFLTYNGGISGVEIMRQIITFIDPFQVIVQI